MSLYKVFVITFFVAHSLGAQIALRQGAMPDIKFQAGGLIVGKAGEDLVQAIANRDEQEAQQLIYKGADVNYEDERVAYMTPLMVAANRNMNKIADLLISYGADVNSVSQVGTTPLMFAVHENNLPLVKTLIKEKAKLDMQDRNGVTALMYAAHGNHVDVMKELIAAGANLNLQTLSGQTALDLARKHPDAAKILEQAGAVHGEQWLEEKHEAEASPRYAEAIGLGVGTAGLAGAVYTAIRGAYDRLVEARKKAQAAMQKESREKKRRQKQVPTGEMSVLGT
jgi:uncharacterized protein